MKDALILLRLTMLTCVSKRAVKRKPVSAGALAYEYEQSRDATRRKYDGKEIIVRGYVLTGATMPLSVAEQGSVRLKEAGRERISQVTCWFSQEQVLEFSKVQGSQYLTNKGIFNGEAGAELKFCKLLKVE